MADIFRISDATALALHSMVYLANKPERHATTSEIAEIYGVSRHHLAKVHQRLTKAELLRSYRGPSGGVGLARSPEHIRLLTIYEAMEGSMVCRPCLFGKDQCPRLDCVLGRLLPELSRQVREYFEQTTLEQLVQASHRESEEQ